MKKNRIILVIISAIILISIFFFVSKKSQYNEFMEFEKQATKYQSTFGLVKNIVVAYVRQFPSNSDITNIEIINFIGSDTTEEEQGNIAFLYTAAANVFRNKHVKIKKYSSTKEVHIYYETNSNYPIWLETPKEISFVDFLFLKKNILLLGFDVRQNRQRRTNYLPQG